MHTNLAAGICGKDRCLYMGQGIISFGGAVSSQRMRTGSLNHAGLLNG